MISVHIVNKRMQKEKYEQNTKKTVCSLLCIRKHVCRHKLIEWQDKINSTDAQNSTSSNQMLNIYVDICV